MSDTDYPDAPMGSLAAQDNYYDPFDVEKFANPVANALVRTPEYMARAAGQLIDTARDTPFGLRREDVTDIPGSAQPIDPLVGQSMGTVLNTMGTGAIAGVPVKGAETLLGAGAVRKIISKDNIPGTENAAGTTAINWNRERVGLGGPAVGADRVVMDLPVRDLEAAHKATDPSMFIEKPRQQVLNHMTAGKPISLPEVSVYQGQLRYTNGRNRVAAAREMGADTVPVAVDRDSVSSLQGLLNQYGKQQINAPYISNPVRVANPGVYKRPDVIAAEAAARVEPEHPALKQLFGVTRQDLYDISQQGRRQGNMEPDLWQPGRPGKPNEAALAVMNPANERRIIDTLSEARKYPGLEQGMVPWYVMDPMYQRMVQLVGPERAAKEYRDFNMSVTPFSAGSSVPSEINRGTAANMMRQRGEYDIFKKYGGIAADKRTMADYPEILRDVNGIMGHLNQANPVERYMQTGSHGYGKDQVKINLYSGASGVPQTGFQTTGAVPDAHFTRAIGVPDARKIPEGFNDYMGGTEYRQIGPWYRNKIADPLGIEAVPAQALMWGTFGPQTGVKTKIGAGKLELMSKQMWERAQKLGVDPETFRDQVLRGEQHSELEDDSAGMGSLASLSRYG